MAWHWHSRLNKKPYRVSCDQILTRWLGYFPTSSVHPSNAVHMSPVTDNMMDEAKGGIRTRMCAIWRQSSINLLRFVDFLCQHQKVSLFQISGVWTEFLKVYIRTRKCLLHLKAWTKNAPWDILVINETRAEGLQSLAVTASGLRTKNVKLTRW